MTVEIHGVLRQHEWIGQVSVDYDLDEDLFSLAVKRAAAYGWSSTHLGAGAELGGRRWDHADAGGDWSQDGRVRQLAWLTVYPATGLQAQHLPVLPMTQVLLDALRRVGQLHLTGLRVRTPVQFAPDTGFDLRAEADWFSLAAPDATTDVTVTISTESSVSPTQVCDLAVQRGYGHLHLKQAPPCLDSDVAPSAVLSVEVPVQEPGMTLTGSIPEWTSDAAAWVAEVIIDSLRASGARAPAEITVCHDSE
jgi:hypothetical protein